MEKKIDDMKIRIDNKIDEIDQRNDSRIIDMKKMIEEIKDLLK